MTEKNQASAVHALIKKGDGVLVKRGNVWTYAGAPIDRSGTNLQLPEEYITEAEVHKLLASGELVAATHSAMHDVLSVRLKNDGDAISITTAQAGTADAGTELPRNSRPEQDAGARQLTPAEAAAAAERAAQSFVTRPAAVVVEGAPARLVPVQDDKGQKR